MQSMKFLLKAAQLNSSSDCPAGGKEHSHARPEQSNGPLCYDVLFQEERPPLLSCMIDFAYPF